MPIVVPREGPLTVPADALTPDQRDRLWTQIIKNWVEKHPEELQRMITEAKEDE